MDDTLARKIRGIGRCMHKNQLKEYFLVLFLRNPNNRLIMTVREKRPMMIAASEVKSIKKNTLKGRGRSRGFNAPFFSGYRQRRKAHQ